MSGLLIDDKGRCWPDDRDLPRRFGCDNPRADILGFAVCERGFIHLHYHNRTARVSIRERRFNLITFAGAILELGRMDPARIMLRVFGDRPPAFSIFADLWGFAAHVEPLAAGEPLEMRVPRLAASRNPRVVNLPPFASVRPIVDLWKHTRGQMSEDIVPALAAGGVFDRMVMVRQLPRSERLVTEQFGSAFKFMQASDIVGRDLDDMPDREYGEWTAASYRRVARGRNLRIESCQVRIRKSAATALSVRYDRVLMPWRSKGNDLFTMCVSLEREKPVVVSSSMLVTL